MCKYLGAGGRSKDCVDENFQDMKCKNISPTSINLANYHEFTYDHGGWKYIALKQRYLASYGYIDEKPHFEVISPNHLFFFVC